MFPNPLASTIEHFGVEMESHAEARRIAGMVFDHAYARAVLAKWWVKLSGKSNELRTLSHQPQAARQTMGMTVVPLNRIVGTEGRSEDFDADFRPLKKHSRERWINVAAARRTRVVLPAVELVQDRDEYYVRDGHHRISVAKAMGQLEIDARLVNS